VDGKAVSVNLTTKGREKLIKTTKDGKPAAYVHTVPIRVDGIESGRNLAEAFREAIRGCGVK